MGARHSAPALVTVPKPRETHSGFSRRRNNNGNGDRALAGRRICTLTAARKGTSHYSKEGWEGVEFPMNDDDDDVAGLFI